MSLCTYRILRGNVEHATLENFSGSVKELNNSIKSHRILIKIDSTCTSMNFVIEELLPHHEVCDDDDEELDSVIRFTDTVDRLKEI